MQPDFILIGVILFCALGMVISCRDSRKMRPADQLGFIFGIRRKHNESCIELRGRIHAHQLDFLRATSGFESAMQRANEGLAAFGMACSKATANFHKNRKVIHNK